MASDKTRNKTNVFIVAASEEFLLIHKEFS